MKRIITSIFVFFLIIGNLYAQELGTPTPLQQIINAMPAIPIPLIGKNLKFDFGGDNWIAKVNGKNFLAGNCLFEETGNGYILTLKTTSVWTGAVEEVIDLLQKARVPLGPAAGPLRTAARLAARVAKWIPFKGSAIILEYKEGPPVNISFVKMEKQAENTQTVIASSTKSGSLVQGSTGSIRNEVNMELVADNYTVVNVIGKVQQNSGGIWINIMAGDIIGKDTQVRTFSNESLVVTAGSMTISFPSNRYGRIAYWGTKQ